MLTETAPSEDYVQVDVRITGIAPGFAVGHCTGLGLDFKDFQ